MRKARIERKTKETEVVMELNIDGKGDSAIGSKIGFLNHMLEAFTKHGLFDLEAEISGDLHVDQHHTVEDAGIVLGKCFSQALGEKRGIARNGFCIYPMDEALVRVAVDISGRPFLKFDAEFEHKTVGDFQTDVVADFFHAFASNAGVTIHIKVEYGRSDHHKIEAMFKAFAKAMQQACSIEERLGDAIPSTKGNL